MPEAPSGFGRPTSEETYESSRRGSEESGMGYSDVESGEEEA